MLHKLYQWLIRLLQFLFIKRRPRRVVNMSLYVTNEKHIDLITIAFNNVKVIDKQIEMVRKNVCGVYNYIVADNSSDKVASRKIESLCRERNVIYVRLPKNWLGLIGGSYSHAASLNYMYKRLIKRKNAIIFGFIDHDLFPISKIDIEEKMGESPIYGRVVERGCYWYLWSGLCFFRKTYLSDRSVDFMPATIDGKYLDSGGGNWNEIYSQIERGKFNECETIQHHIHDNGIDYHSDYIHIMGGCWLHLINGSNWANERPRNLNAFAKRINGEKYPIEWGNKKSKDDEVDEIVKYFECVESDK